MVHLVKSCHTLPQKIAAKATHVATGIFAYPLFLLLSGIGLFVKLIEVPGMKKHNASVSKTIFNKMESQVLHLSAAIDDTRQVLREGWIFDQDPDKDSFVITDDEFNKMKTNPNSTPKDIQRRITELTSEFKKLYFIMKKEPGETFLAISLFTRKLETPAEISSIGVSSSDTANKVNQKAID